MTHRWYDESLPEDQSSNAFPQHRVARPTSLLARIVDESLWVFAAILIGLLIFLPLFLG